MKEEAYRILMMHIGFAIFFILGLLMGVSNNIPKYTVVLLFPLVGLEWYLSETYWNLVFNKPKPVSAVEG